MLSIIFPSPRLTPLSLSNQRGQNRRKGGLEGRKGACLFSYLVDCYGGDKLGRWTKIRCFVNKPTINSSLKFLRKTPWPRTKVENLYIVTKRNQQNKPRRRGR
ncbi:MAG: DUF2132 domain-containing protein [Candidatus Electrothrix sp. ATG2]|nr:DUF2132 domain-containing protein [Candidatus Electrothrix sp. ATG2]